MADHKKLKEQMEKTTDPKEALSIIILHLEKKNRKLEGELAKEKETTLAAKYMLDLHKRDLNNLTLKLNAYKKDYQRTKGCLDAALGFVGYEQERAFRKESLYTLWLENKAEERNIELARDRERLAGSCLLESENLYAHLVRRFLVCSFCKRKYIIAHLHDTLDLPHREREDYAFCDTCEKGACRKCEDQEICQRCEVQCHACCGCKE